MSQIYGKLEIHLTVSEEPGALCWLVMHEIKKVKIERSDFINSGSF